MKNSFLLLFLLAVLGSAFAAVFQHKVHHRESLKTKLIKEGRREEYYALKQRKLHGKFSNFKSTSQNIDDYGDIEYYINITVGTPEQFFTVALDTTFGNLLIPDIDCFICRFSRKFDSSKSSTYQGTDHYLYGNRADGVYGQDFVRFGNSGMDQLVIPKAMFGQYLTYMYVDPADGIMGLGFTAENPDGIDSPITTAINSGILDSPVVTIFLKSVWFNNPTGKSGIVTYGAVDTTNCDRNIVYEPLSDPNSFNVSLKKVSLGSSQFSDGWNVSVNPNVNFILGPKPIVEAFAKEVNAVFQDGDYMIDCKTKFNLNLTIGTTVYTLTEKEMILNYGNSVCLLSLLSQDGNGWTFGATWFQAFCTVLDYGKKRVGFTKIVSS